MLGFSRADIGWYVTLNIWRNTLKFRHLGNNRYFPPIAPNGRIYAVLTEQENQVENLCLTSEGIISADIKTLWSEILGIYYNDDYWEIIFRNCSGKSLRFRRGMPCVMFVNEGNIFTACIQEIGRAHV